MPVKRRKKLLKVPRKKSSADRFAWIEKSLKKQTKADLVSLVIKLAKDNEGMMTEDIEACLKPVIRAVKSTGDDLARKWAFAMLLEDRVGFICEKELKKMAGQ